MVSRRTPPTYPSPKYGPTPHYGTCELDDRNRARATCPQCGGHFCLAHADHDTHRARSSL